MFGSGASLSTWFALIVQRADGGVGSIKELALLVAAHWRRGLMLLDEEWRQAGEDESKFIRRLVEVAGLPLKGERPAGASVGGDTTGPGPIPVPIGEVSIDTATGTNVDWVLNGPGGSPHIAVMGGVGSGKTRTAAAMLKVIRAASQVLFLAFDFKGDLAIDLDGKGYGLDRIFEATVLQPPRQPIPLDVLALRTADDITINQGAIRFRDSFGRLNGNPLGAKQRSMVADAAEAALTGHLPTEIHHIQESLHHLYDEREMAEDGALATMDEICRFPLFSPTLTPEQFFKRSWIIRLPQEVPESSRGLIVNLILDSLDNYLNSLPDSAMTDGRHRALRIVCLIDEAHRILGTKLPSLSNLIRMSRSKGGSIMLISQSPDYFSGVDDEFLSEMGLVAAFGSNARPASVAKIFGKGTNLSKLATGQCYVKIRGEETTRRLTSWQRD